MFLRFKKQLAVLTIFTFIFMVYGFHKQEALKAKADAGTAAVTIGGFIATQPEPGPFIILGLGMVACGVAWTNREQIISGGKWLADRINDAGHSVNEVVTDKTIQFTDWFKTLLQENAPNIPSNYTYYTGGNALTISNVNAPWFDSYSANQVSLATPLALAYGHHDMIVSFKFETGTYTVGEVIIPLYNGHELLGKALGNNVFEFDFNAWSPYGMNYVNFKTAPVFTYLPKVSVNIVDNPTKTSTDFGTITLPNATTVANSLTGYATSIPYTVNPDYPIDDVTPTTVPDVLNPPADTPTDPPADPPADDTDLDFTPLKIAGETFTTKFPFSLPWDLLNSFKSVKTSSIKPNFDFDLTGLPIATICGLNSLHFDLTGFDSLFSLVRFFELLLFDIGLLLATRKLMGGGV